MTTVLGNARQDDRHVAGGCAARRSLGAVPVFACLAALWLAISFAPAAAKPVKIWFRPRQSSIDPSRPPGQRIRFDEYDFTQMLASDAAWQEAKRDSSVLIVAYHTIEHYPDLGAVVRWANSSRGKIATTGSFLYVPDRCVPTPMEGLDFRAGTDAATGASYANEVVAAVRKWKKAGGRLDIIVMDSPLYFGFFKAARYCHFSVEEVAARSAATLAEIRKIYPAIEVADADGPGETPVADWLPVLGTFIDDFERSSGARLDDFAMDLHWSDTWKTGYNWPQAAAATAQFLRRKHVSPGMYINTHGHETDDREWIAGAEGHAAEIAGLHLDLDFVVVSSWSRLPEHNLPETDPTTLTSLVLYAYDRLGK